MQQYRYMKKREKARFRTKRILERRSPLTIEEIYENMIDDEFKWTPLNTNQLSKLIRGQFEVTKVLVKGGFQNLYHLKEESP